MAHADAPTAGGKHSFYGYMFEKDKKPTPQLDALLRGIANYIIEDVGDKQVKTLTPSKLASFYKVVGGNYDALFVDIPHNSLSYIYASTGCEHTLQPTGNDYAPPSIPALTVRGFSRWQSIEILLGPEEHVPYMQRAVKNCGIRDPDNHELFPPVLPSEVFPLHPDADVEKWHSSCAEKLRQEATPADEEGPALPPRRPKVHVQTGYTHVPAPRSTRNFHNLRDYFPSPQFTPIRRVRPVFGRNQSYHGPNFAESPRPSRTRRSSVPGNSSSPNLSVSSPDPPETLRPPFDERYRRHSHPRHEKTPSASSVSSDDKKKPSKGDTPVAGEGNEQKPQRRYKYHPQDQSTSIRFNIPRNLRPDRDSPDRSNSHSSSNSRAGAGSRHSRNNSDTDSPRERRRGHKTHSHPSIDASGQLSAPFMQGNSSRPVSSRSNSSARRPARNDLNINDHHPRSRRASIATEEDEDRDSTGSIAYHRKREERSARSQDRGKTDRKRREKMRERELRERERDREREREKFERDRLERGREKEKDVVGDLLSRSASIGAKLGLKFGRSGSTDDRRDQKERERERDERDRKERERGRNRDRSRERREHRDGRAEFHPSNLASPSRAGDARRYPVDGVIRR